MDFNLTFFGELLKNMRDDLDLSLKNVSELSGIHFETIRRIECGKVIPKFDTLELLAPIYKQDLNSLFLRYRLHDYSHFYEIKNRLETKFDNDEVHTLEVELKELEILIKHTTNSFYKNLMNQLILLTHAIILYKNNNNYNIALDKLIEAIKISSPSFELTNYKSLIYSSMEIRILMNIAFVLNRLNQREKYLELMEFCFNSIEPIDELFPKICHNLAGVYRRNKNFEMALEFSNMGIESCRKIRLFGGLSILYYGKGISEYNLNKEDYMDSIKTSILLCEAFGQDKFKNTIIKNCKDIFGIILQ